MLVSEYAQNVIDNRPLKYGTRQSYFKIIKSLGIWETEISALNCEAKTREVFSNALLEPIEPFKTGTAPWKSKCLTCGSIVNGRYSNLVKGQSGCRTCYYASQKDKK